MRWRSRLRLLVQVQKGRSENRVAFEWTTTSKQQSTQEPRGRREDKPEDTRALRKP